MKEALYMVIMFVLIYIALFIHGSSDTIINTFTKLNNSTIDSLETEKLKLEIEILKDELKYYKERNE